MILMLNFLLPLAIILLVVSNPGETLAHGIGQTYTLPLPLWLYLWASAAVVLLSFVVITALFPNYRPKYKEKGKISFKVPVTLINFAKFSSLFLFFLTIVIGIFGNQDPSYNFAPIFFWSTFVISFVVFSAFLGNWWQYLNPVMLIYSFFKKVSKEDRRSYFQYPQKLSYFPSLFFYFAFVWFELVSQVSDKPRAISLLIAIYATFMLWGMGIFGPVFLQKADFLTVFSKLLSKISFVSYKNSRMYLVNPLSLIVKIERLKMPLVLFVILTLAGVAFDSFSESPSFWAIVSFFNLSAASYKFIRTIGLVVMIVPFAALYFAFLNIGNLIVSEKKKVSDLASYYAVSLIPISVAYFVAHYFPLFVVGIQNIAMILGYSLGFFSEINPGKVNLALLNPTFVWYAQIVLVVLGHIAAVLCAHFISFKVYSNSKSALLSQYPVTLLMVVYTFFSLWLLSQPIVVSP